MVPHATISNEESAETRLQRERLFGKHGIDAQKDVQRAAIAAIDRYGANGSRRAWWAFEGFTSVDCWLETDDTILLIEGKRKESLSKSTKWYPARNQLVRNLEAVSEAAGAKAFGVLLIAESKSEIPQVVLQLLENSLPHLSDNERSALGEHYLGGTTWRNVCEATGLDFEMLPDTTEDVVRRLKEGWKCC